MDGGTGDSDFYRRYTQSAPASPISTLRREGDAPPPTPPHSWWRTAERQPSWGDFERVTTPQFEVRNGGNGSRPLRPPHDRVYVAEGGLNGVLRGPPRQPSGLSITVTNDGRTYAWAQPKAAAKAKVKKKDGLFAETMGLSGARAMTLPADFVRWDIMPAGRSTIQMDHPKASRHLDYSRRLGEPSPWRGSGEDGMFMQPGSFGKMVHPNTKNTRFTNPAFFTPSRQSYLLELRREARAQSSRISS
eukprot:CAMPEP_0197662572 /NCGR_PEP_ID=MMETSP1338-20131121/53988_1 /TAXON_ID=43686 ORGANISM="Pelagodinium beii, Strain RCC1491" /NCGR_SAMPLE_ID=MMETSP1338 /ASSEMBLY_ACC=CAM_ASM_000754 /LENGTH=245 /DNA_ID=CAMNT_0043240479 /DNA_START=33 /DNA_END=770 /DNA_ORIENTATION=+